MRGNVGSNNFIVYKHTSPDGKVYIGITCQKPEQRWRDGKGYPNNPHFTNAINKYGWHNFIHEILFSGLSREEAKIKETALIKEYNATNRTYGYNITDGGECASGMKGKHHSKETKQRMSLAHKGFKHTEESLQKMRNVQKGKQISREQSEAVSKARSIPIRCVETGVIYKNAHDVKRFFGFNPSHIYEVCKGIGHRRTVGGFHWERVVIREV